MYVVDCALDLVVVRVSGLHLTMDLQHKLNSALSILSDAAACSRCCKRLMDLDLSDTGLKASSHGCAAVLYAAACIACIVESDVLAVINC